MQGIQSLCAFRLRHSVAAAAVRHRLHRISHFVLELRGTEARTEEMWKHFTFLLFLGHVGLNLCNTEKVNSHEMTENLLILRLQTSKLSFK